MLHLSAKELNRNILNGNLSVVSLLQQTFRRIDLIKDLNAYITENEENAILSAEQLDERRLESRSSLSLLQGLPIAVKDNFCVEGMKTSCGSRMLDNFTAPYSATVVERSVAAGAIVVGKTNLDEFAMGSGTIDSFYGPTKNVWRSGLDYRLEDQSGESLEAETGSLQSSWAVAGGSSGGSAVAVAAGSAVFGLGSDTGGSVRIPAAWCGIPSLKPSYGLISRHGLIPLVNSLDVPGLMARTVEDLDMYFRILSGRDENDSTTVDYKCEETVDIKSLKIGIPHEYFCDGMTDEVVQSVSDACNLFENNGAIISPASLPHTDLAVPCYSVLNPCEVASNMARYDGLQFGLRGEDETSTEALFAETRALGFNEVVRGRILAGNYFLLKKHYREYFLQALKIRRMILNDFNSVWKDVDFLLTPVTLSDAPSYEDYVREDNRTQTAKQDHCTQPVNLAGLPAATVPCRLSSRSMPLSLQLIGPYGSDLKLLRVARWLESQVNFPRLILK